MPQSVQNTFKNDLKWPQMDNSEQHIGVGNQIKCASQMVALQPAVNAYL